jgi:hypothetical protein
MNRVALAVALSCAVFSGAIAADQTCKSQADAKKLAGAALTSFMKKCESDAQTACDKQAADKKLSGADERQFYQEMREGCNRHLDPLSESMEGRGGTWEQTGLLF